MRADGTLLGLATGSALLGGTLRAVTLCRSALGGFAPAGVGTGCAGIDCGLPGATVEEVLGMETNSLHLVQRQRLPAASSAARSF